jgi:hypothetical protein
MYGDDFALLMTLASESERKRNKIQESVTNTQLRKIS